MDGFITLQSHGRVVHLAELHNPDGEDIVLWKEHNDQADEFQCSPLNLAIASEETKSTETDEVEMDEETDYLDIDSLCWENGLTFDQEVREYWSVGYADGHAIILGSDLPWDKQVAASELQEPLPHEEHVNGHALDLAKVGSRRGVISLNANGDRKSLEKRRLQPRSDARNRSDKGRELPIRQARRNNRLN